MIWSDERDPGRKVEDGRGRGEGLQCPCELRALLNEAPWLRVCRREAGERVGCEHAHLRRSGLREIEPAVVAEEPGGGAAFSEKGRVERLDLGGKCAEAGHDRAGKWKRGFHAAFIP